MATAKMSVARLFAAMMALALVVVLAARANQQKSSMLEGANVNQGAIPSESDIIELAWHPKKAAEAPAVLPKLSNIPGLAPWAKALLNTAAREQIQEHKQYAQDVKEQQALLASETHGTRKLAVPKARQERVQVETRKSADINPKALAKVLANAVRHDAKPVPKKLQAQEEMITKDATSSIDAYGQVKSFFHAKQAAIERSKAKAIKRVKEMAAEGEQRIVEDEKLDIKKIDNDAQARLTDIFRQEASEEKFLRQQSMHAVEKMVSAASYPSPAAAGAAIVTPTATIFDKREQQGILEEEKKQALRYPPAAERQAAPAAAAALSEKPHTVPAAPQEAQALAAGLKRLAAKHALLTAAAAANK